MKKNLIFMLAVTLLAGVVYSAQLSRVKLGTFKAVEARQINTIVDQVEGELAVIYPTMVDTNTTTDTTDYEALGAGQLLCGGAGDGTNALWFASAVGVSNWVQVSSFAE